eukprot:2705696-Rhodomonas_salina.5
MQNLLTKAVLMKIRDLEASVARGWPITLTEFTCESQRWSVQGLGQLVGILNQCGCLCVLGSAFNSRQWLAMAWPVVDWGAWVRGRHQLAEVRRRDARGDARVRAGAAKLVGWCYIMMTIQMLHFACHTESIP